MHRSHQKIAFEESVGAHFDSFGIDGQCGDEGKCTSQMVRRTFRYSQIVEIINGDADRLSHCKKCHHTVKKGHALHTHSPGQWI